MKILKNHHIPLHTDFRLQHIDFHLCTKIEIPLDILYKDWFVIR